MSGIPIPVLHECFSYNAETGLLIWKVRPLSHFKHERAAKAWNTRYAGTTAGSLNKSLGYMQVAIFDVKEYVHRIAFAMSSGEWPNGEVDHKDRNRQNNRLDNLRESAVLQNRRNASPHKNTASGFRGVSAKRDKWQARIRSKSVGVFDTPEEAAAAYNAAALEKYGDFAFQNTI